MSANTSFDWSALLKVAVQQGGMKPSEFWCLTPAELSLCLGLDQVAPPLNRARLMELDRLYSTNSGEKKDVDL